MTFSVELPGSPFGPCGPDLLVSIDRQPATPASITITVNSFNFFISIILFNKYGIGNRRVYKIT